MIILVKSTFLRKFLQFICLTKITIFRNLFIKQTNLEVPMSIFQLDICCLLKGLSFVIYYMAMFSYLVSQITRIYSRMRIASVRTYVDRYVPRFRGSAQRVAYYTGQYRTCKTQCICQSKYLPRPDLINASGLNKYTAGAR